MKTLKTNVSTLTNFISLPLEGIYYNTLCCDILSGEGKVSRFSVTDEV